MFCSVLLKKAPWICVCDQDCKRTESEIMYPLHLLALLVALGLGCYIFWSQLHKAQQEEGQQAAEKQRLAEEQRAAEEQLIAVEAAEAERLAAKERQAAAEKQAAEAAKSRLVNTGPRLYYYKSKLTWDSSAGFCQEMDSALCSYEQLCRKIHNGAHFVHGVIPGDHWIAISGREWLAIGTAYGTPCVRYKSLGSPATLGDTIEAKPWKGYVSCCKETIETEPAVAFRYIGETATYASSRDYCEHHGRRLCYSSEVCSRNKPAYGVLQGDHWIPVKDRENEWIHIGTHHNLTCRHHGVTYTRPSWGQRTDGSSRDFIGYLYCCK